LRAFPFCAKGVPVRAGVPWCLEPESNRHAAFRQAADFKSAVSTNFTIEARAHCETKNDPHASLPPEGAFLPWGGPAAKTKQPRQLAGLLDLEARTGVEPI
jgi:hypothetical protein